MTVKDRLILYIKFKGIRNSHFEKSIGASNGYINSLKKSPSAEKLNQIRDQYNDLNIEWLLTGEGEMIKMEGKSLDINYDLVDGEVVEVVSKKKADIFDNSQILYRKDGVIQVDHSEYMEVEFRDLSVAAGPLNRVEEGQEKKTMLVPKEYDRGEYLVVRVDGPSMDDGSIYSIGDGANILIKKYHLEKGERLPIRGNLFVIDSKDGQALKQIIEHNIQEGYIMCHSYNSDFSDYKVPLEDVIDFYIYRKIVGYRPPVRDIN